MDAPPDPELVRRCRAGDESAWELLVERYARYVYAIATRVYRLEPPDAEDVFQEVFIRAYERLGTLRDADSLRPWLAQTTRRCAIDTLRKAGREISTDDLPEESDDVFDRLDEALAVRASLDGLSPECREILDRFFCRDESYRTIADLLNLPAGTVASRISRCLGRLREVLEPGRNEPPAPSGEKVGRRR